MLRNVLVVDDDKPSLEHLTRLLQAGDHEIRTALTVRRAMLMLRYPTPDLVFVDINMPGLSGLEICRFLKLEPRTAHVPVIVVSAFNDPTHRKLARQAGSAYYLPKPIFLADFEVALAHVDALASGTPMASARRSASNLEPMASEPGSLPKMDATPSGVTPSDPATASASDSLWQRTVGPVAEYAATSVG